MAMEKPLTYKSPRSACWRLAKMAPFCFQAKWRFCWVSNGRWKSLNTRHIQWTINCRDKIYSHVSIIYLFIFRSYSDYSVKFWHLFALSFRFIHNFSWSSAPPESPQSFRSFLTIVLWHLFCIMARAGDLPSLAKCFFRSHEVSCEFLDADPSLILINSITGPIFDDIWNLLW